MKHLFTFLFTGFIALLSQAQTPLLVEHFDYPAGDSLQANGWTGHSAATTNRIKVTDGGLSWSQTPYLGSGIGNAAAVNNTGSDENRALGTFVRSGAVYAGFLIRVNGTVTTNNQGYFFHMGEYADTTNPVYTTISTAFRARTYVVPGSTAANFRMGITFNSSTAPSTPGVDASRDLDTGKTYLVVVKYQFVPGDANDSVSLYVFDDGADLSTEPSMADAGPVAGTQGDVNVMQYIALRQFNAAQNITVDGIVVRTEWDWLAASNPTPVAPVLIGPADNTSLTLEGPANTPVVINWTAAQNMSGAVTYEWQADARATGTFSPAALALPSDNMGADTTLSLTFGAIDMALASLGIEDGDTLKAVWRVRAVSGTDTLYSNTFNIDLIREEEDPASASDLIAGALSVYPNPSKGTVNLELNQSLKGMLEIRVADASGRVVYNAQESASSVITLNLNELSRGLYWIEVQSEQARYTQKLMIQK